MTQRWNRVHLGMALAGLLLTAGTAALSADTNDEDVALKTRIEARLADVVLHQPAAIEVDVQDGTVVLAGQVPTVSDRWTVERAARKVTPEVESHVRVVPKRELTTDELRTSIVRAVLNAPYYGVFDAVGVEIEDGQVRLTGSVYRPSNKTDIEERVARVVGVRDLTSAIVIQPLSRFDESLRRQCYRAIYANTAFSRLAIGPNPPIRILVDHGRITLAGSVTNTADRDLLTLLASGVPSFGPINNEVRVEKVKRPPTKKAEALVTV
jgi:osmotically-inducible protein OsmY